MIKLFNYFILIFLLLYIFCVESTKTDLKINDLYVDLFTETVMDKNNLRAGKIKRVNFLVFVEAVEDKIILIKKIIKKLNENIKKQNNPKKEEISENLKKIGSLIEECKNFINQVEGHGKMASSWDICHIWEFYETFSHLEYELASKIHANLQLEIKIDLPGKCEDLRKSTISLTFEDNVTLNDDIFESLYIALFGEPYGTIKTINAECLLSINFLFDLIVEECSKNKFLIKQLNILWNIANPALKKLFKEEGMTEIVLELNEFLELMQAKNCKKHINQNK
uniref:Uncharacterized protein n=1 Tax=Meloidogyne enterolobii TaxID=390850 RepID=A0A6V7VIA3_MELEN|nr:unnamed protein product [Meloidogyne enterolobii]